MPLEIHDLAHLTAAEGYAELGMYLESNEELENIDPEVRHVPEVLAVRLEVYRGLKKWELLQVVSGKLAEFEPDEPRWTVSLAFATRRAESLEAARAVLLRAVERSPEVGIFQFNLACYECQLGDMAAAKARLTLAFNIDLAWRQAALDDEDLKPLWESL